jgi:threonine dehydrogenase-like Zn-dependent dehydrogenase
VQRGLEVHVLDQVTDGPKPAVVEALGASYHHSSVEEIARVAEPDVVIEATGVPSLVFEAMANTAAFGVVCLTGVSTRGRTIPADVGRMNRDLVLENDVVVGSVNANLRHWASAAQALAAADRDWLARLVTRRVPLERYAEALERHDDDIKVVLTLR